MTRVLAVWVTGLAAGALVLITLALLRTLAPVSGRRRVACLLCPTSQILVTWFVHVAVYEGRIDELASLAVAACTAGCSASARFRRWTGWPRRSKAGGTSGRSSCWA